jgi:glycosyltransferase involved in cell wall biosynthesis
LRQLQVAYDIDLVTFSRVHHQPDRAAREAARGALRSVAAFVAEPTPLPCEQSTLRRIGDHLRSLFSGRAYTYYQYHSRHFAAQLRAVLRKATPDLVHLDSVDLHRWLLELPRVPTACTHHDIESELLRLRARRVNGTVLRHYMLLQANRVEQLQRELCPQLALNVMMSEVDAQRLRALAPGVATTVVPNGSDTDYFQPNDAPAVAGRVLFVGPTYSHPNRDAVEFLLQEIWPVVHAADRSTSLRLVGSSAPLDRARYDAAPAVRSLGYLADIRPALSEACCCVVPIRVGGGTRLKLLDAWAMGKAVVSTSIGCEGLEVADGENILIRDSPRAFADAVLEVLHDAGLRSHLERNARRTAVDVYSWSVVGQRIRTAYDELLGRSTAPSEAVRPVVAASAPASTQGRRVFLEDGDDVGSVRLEKLGN